MKTHLLAICIIHSAGIAFSQSADYYGTLHPFASEAVYQVLTDRFVDGDPNNNHQQQGGERPTWERKLFGPNGDADYVGYMGGDFAGLHQHGEYITSMGFTAVSISPIVDNPDEAFISGDPTFVTAFGARVGLDGGKAGYHGYWGVNFYKVDEHLESPGLEFRDFTRRMRSDHDLKIVLDIVANHGSPAWSMPVEQEQFGEIFDAQGVKIADHQNRDPSQLNHAQEALHRFYNHFAQPNQLWEWDEGKNLARLSDLNHSNPAVLEYLAGAYLQWIEQGAAAFRVDTIAWMPHEFWRAFAERIRSRHPGFFMYAEHFSGDTQRISAHQRPENGGISILDFPGSGAMKEVFENRNSSYATLLGYLHLDDRTYTNPYELATFYDNHDMKRLDASDNGFVDANNWLFTSRGIPVVYSGSEMGFMRGLSEHFGNRNYFGVEGIAAAQNHRIRRHLTRVAHLRKRLPALQRGLQVNLDFNQNTAALLRVFQKDDVAQTALVLLNKADQTETITVNRLLSTGAWVDADNGETIAVTESNRSISRAVPAHGVKALVFSGPVNNAELASILNHQMEVLGHQPGN